jgi:hypothetical protein
LLVFIASSISSSTFSSTLSTFDAIIQYHCLFLFYKWARRDFDKNSFESKYWK